MGVFNSNFPSNRCGSRASGSALEAGLTVGSRLVFLLNAVFVYCKTLKTFLQPFQAKNGTIESGLKADYARKIENFILILQHVTDLTEILKK